MYLNLAIAIDIWPVERNVLAVLEAKARVISTVRGLGKLAVAELHRGSIGDHVARK